MASISCIRPTKWHSPWLIGFMCLVSARGPQCCASNASTNLSMFGRACVRTLPAQVSLSPLLLLLLITRRLDCITASAVLAKKAMLSQCGCQGIALLFGGLQLLLQVFLVALQLLQNTSGSLLSRIIQTLMTIERSWCLTALAP